MTTNVFFFRGSYDLGEKIDRIPAHRFSVDTPEILDTLSEIGETPQEVQSLSKGDYLHRVSSELDLDQYEEHIDELFENYGKKGDTFNLQLFTIADALSYDRLRNRAAKYEGSRLENAFSHILAEPLALTNTSHNDDNHTMDFCFKTATRQEDIEPDEDVPIQVVRRDTEEIADEYGENFMVRAPTSYQIEARVFTEYGMATVSNSSNVRSGLQTDITAIISEMGQVPAENEDEVVDK